MIFASKMSKLCCLTLVFLGVVAIVAGKLPPKHYEFGFNAGTHFRRENRGPEGTEGEYGFETPDGCMHIVRYTSFKKTGYKIVGTEKRNCKPMTRLSPARRFTTTRKPTTTRKFTTTTTTTTTTTRRPTTTTTTTTTPRPTTTRRTTTTRKPTTRIPTTTRRTTTTRRPTKSPLKPRPLPPVSNRINKPQGKSLEPIGPPEDIKRPRILAKDDPDPVYSFGFEAPGHGHTQAGLPDGTKKGEYFFDSPDGWRRIVSYVATKKGFFPKMSRVRIPTTTPRPPPTTTETEGRSRGSDIEADDPESIGKQLDDDKPIPTNGCPYFFYTNTNINFHWERCLLNGTRVGEYGKLGPDAYAHKVTYSADARGYRPKVTRALLTPEQKDQMAEYQARAFIIPKIDEERDETERRIQEWISQNSARINDPL